MSTFQSLLKWVKDPFGKNELTNKHDILLGRLYEANVSARKTINQTSERSRARSKGIGGVNTFDRALLGNRSRHRELRQ